MNDYEKEARKLIGKSFGDRIVYGIIYKSRVSPNKVRSEWYYFVRGLS